MSENSELMRVDFAIDLVHEGQVHAGHELNKGSLIGVRLAAHDLKAVYTILVHSLCRRYSENRDASTIVRGTYVAGADDRAVPLAHHDIVSVLQTVRAGPIADAFLTFLELFEKEEIAGNWRERKQSVSRLDMNPWSGLLFADI